MAHFPNTFAAEMQPLPLDLGTDRANEALQFMNENGFVVETGLTPYLAGSIGRIASQDDIREYCPKDESSRFGTLEAAERWVGKPGGRAMFGLAQIVGDNERRWIGYGWTGPEPCEELPEYPITFALRLAREAQGKRLAVPFTTLIVAGSAAIYGADKIGLETWGSNERAISTYEKAGFELVTSGEPEERPTLLKTGEYFKFTRDISHPRQKDGKIVVDDIRRYMAYTAELPEPAQPPNRSLASQTRSQLR